MGKKLKSLPGFVLDLGVKEPRGLMKQKVLVKIVKTEISIKREDKIMKGLEVEPKLKYKLKHKGLTTAEQIEKNQPALALLTKWLEEKVSEEEAEKRENYWKSVQEIIDEERPSGFKLYSQE